MKKFLNDYKSCEKELIAFKEAHENFIKTKQGKSVLMSAFALNLLSKIMLLAMIIQKHKQILQNYPNEKEFNIEINHHLS
ncbi:hypothetical protein H8R34_000798 [Campylobacter jejuni]|uniref:hypothetical protein n=1 Tax=Campylobacter jejuni TaxID=197 RepID=UPI0020CE538F|nr:hypothetical protein [Campylobacter jejuni]UTS64573.1 hypothetical protein H8R34_000798 [Campylobacter jejuni]